MTSPLRPALATVGLFTLLLGLAAPLAMTGFAGAAFPERAKGSPVMRDGQLAGSALLGQDFRADRYFHPRPSATTEPDPAVEGGTRPAPYNAAASAASQLGPTSAALLEAVRQRAAALGGHAVPADAATASGSGLDPDISPANATRQLRRVAEARGLPEARVAALLAAETRGRELGIFGKPRVNVLRLNIALDAMGPGR